jgi:hypothetical protein
MAIGPIDPLQLTLLPDMVLIHVMAALIPKLGRVRRVRLQSISGVSHVKTYE